MRSEGIAVDVRASNAAIQAPREGIAQRYAATLAAQIVQLAAGVAGAGIVPRALGPAAYGDYNFLLTMAATIRGFTEPSVQQAFFTFSAQEDRTGALTRLYGLWVLLQLGIILALISTAAATGWSGRIWPGQRTDAILLVTIVDWAGFLVISLKQLGDAKGLSVKPQLIGAASAVTLLVGLVVLSATAHLTFVSYAVLNIGAAAATIVPLAYWLLVTHRLECWSGSARATARVYISRWWTYSRPLILVEYYTPLVGLLSTYFVQAWYGSVEQGQLALASRWAAVVLLFTGSATGIFWREVASAIGAGDHARATRNYVTFSQSLILITALMSMWLSIASPVLVTRFAGADYTRAIPVLAIMAFYPLQQTFGQLNGTAFKAAGRTAEYRNISIALSIPDMLLTYWLIAPADAIVPGLDLGALGVAVRMVIYGLISVQVYEWRNAKYFDIPYARLLRDRLRVVGAVSAGGLALWTFNRVLVMTFRLDEGAALACGSLLYGTAAAWYLSRTVAAQSLRALIVGRRAAGTDRGN